MKITFNGGVREFVLFAVVNIVLSVLGVLTFGIAFIYQVWWNIGYICKLIEIK